MKWVLNAAVIILMAFILSQTQAEKVMRPKFKEIQIWSDENFITHNITMDASEPHMNFTLNVRQKLQNVDIHIEARITQKLDSDYYLTLNTTIDLCNMLHHNMKSPLGSLISIFLKQYGHILEKCPIEKGLYYLHKIWIPEHPTVGNVAEVDFDINFSGYNVATSKQKTLILNDHFSGEVVVHEVANIKRGLLALLPRVAAG